MKYLPLAELTLAHTYYTDGRCRGVTIEPTTETQRTIKNHRCTLKTSSNGVRILIQVEEDGGPFIPLASEAKFTFVLRQTNPDFTLVTDLSAFSQVAAPVFTNQDALGTGSVPLTLTTRRAWAEETFRVSDPVEGSLFTLGGRPLPRLQKTDFEVAGLGAGSSTPTDYDETGKRITVDASSAKQGDTFSVKYEMHTQMPRGVLAEVEIFNNDSLPTPADGPGKFEIAFAAKQAKWAYYLVADKNSVDYKIEDTGDTPLTFTDGTDLAANPDPTDGVAASLEKQFPDLVRLRFLSDAPVAFQQQTNKTLELMMDEDQIMSPLPNPSLRNFSSLNVVQNGDSQKEEILFHVLKYRK